MSRIGKCLLLTFGFLLGFTASATEVKAATLVKEPSGYYFERQMPNGTRHLSSTWYFYTMDGEIAYCIEPDIHEGVSYPQASWEDTGLSDEIKERMLLIGYYGYTYPNHQTLKYRAATQALLWETAMGSGAEAHFNTQLWSRGANLDISAERAEIENLIANHYTRPSFNGKVYTGQVGKPIELVDTNGVLSNYDVSVSGADYSVNGNTLSITPTSQGTINISLAKQMPYRSSYKIFAGDGIQNMLVPGTVDPVIAGVRVNSIYSSLEITKKDVETITAQGQATLGGAVYGVYEKNTGHLVTTITTDSNGYGKSDAVLSFTDYYVQEISPSNGYNLDTTRYDVTINSETVSISVNETIIKGNIEIYKSDAESDNVQGQATLDGTEYTIYDKNGNFIEVLTTNSNGYAKSSSLIYGDYYLKETKAPTGYNLDTTRYDFKISENNKTITLNLKDNVIKGRIVINKIDSENNSCTPQGQATLSGAIFIIKDSNNNIVDRISTNENCVATSKELPYGNYKIEEQSPSEGYYLNNNKFNVFINDNTDYSVTVKEEVVKNYISILKQYNYVNGNTTFLNAEKNITFEIYYPNGAKYGEVTTDQNGYASIVIPYGIWKFHQVNTNTGYEKIYDFYVTVNYDSELEHYYNILNNKLSSYIQVFKQDKETGKTIAIEDVTFKILNMDTNQFVSQYVSGNVYSEFKTDKDGKFTTYLKLEAGHYKLIEKTNPKGYLLNSDGLEFTIGENSNYIYTTYGAIITLIYEDTPIKGQIEIYKNGEEIVYENNSFYYKKVDLQGVEFSIFAEDDIKSADNNYVYYHKGDLIQVLTTNHNGYAISNKMPLGKYKIVETKTLDSYVLDTTEHIVTLTEIDNKTEIVFGTVKMDNHLKKGNLELTKVDEETEETISNAEIKISTTDGYIVYIGKTDENGKINITNLKLGKYVIEEINAPYGFLLNTEKKYFEIKENNELIKVSIKNKRVEGEITIEKYGEVPSITDNKMTFKLNLLSEVKYGLYAKEDISFNNITRYKKGDLVATSYTDKNGKITFDKLYLGKYFIKELETKDNLILDEKEYDFSLNYKDQFTSIIKSNMHIKNYLKTINIDFSKIDKEDNFGIENTIIELYTENDELIFTGKTDKNGKIDFVIINSDKKELINKLPVGKYYILEKEAEYGYLLNEDKLWFEVTPEDTSKTINMKNERILGTIHIHKDGERVSITDICNDPSNCFVYETKENLEGIKFGVFAREDIILNHIVRYTKDELVVSGFTNEFGNLEFDNLYLGKYYVKELETKTNMILDVNEYDIELKYVDSKTNDISEELHVKNYLIKGNVLFAKYDENGNPLEGVTINLYNAEDTLIGSFVTDENGLVLIKNLEFNDYYITEFATIDGYKLSDERIDFSITDNYIEINLSMVNEKLPQTDLEDNAKEFGILCITFGCIIAVIAISRKRRN